jgi:hypothetical protein
MLVAVITILSGVAGTTFGVIFITAKATDADGNTSSTSSVLSVSVDTTKPTFTSSNEGKFVAGNGNG